MEVAAAKQLLPMPPRDSINSPSSSSSTTTSSPSSAASPSRHQPHPLPPPSPKPVPRVIDTTPFPTTFVQADTASFKQVVQMLTGSDSPSSQPKPAKNHHHHGGGSGLGGGQSGVPCRPKKPAFKQAIYERRSGLKNLKMIAPLAMAAARPSPRKTPEALSPSVLDFPSLALGSPVTPLVADPFNRSPASASPGEEEAAIAHKGFFLHPSPRSAEPPRLLPLFPVTSPRMASSAAAAAMPSSQ